MAREVVHKEKDVTLLSCHDVVEPMEIFSEDLSCHPLGLVVSIFNS
jgi:hypothetical protein